MYEFPIFPLQQLGGDCVYVSGDGCLDSLHLTVL